MLGADGEDTSAGCRGEIFEAAFVASSITVVDRIDDDVGALRLFDGLLLAELAGTLSSPSVRMTNAARRLHLVRSASMWETAYTDRVVKKGTAAWIRDSDSRRGTEER